MSESIGAGLEPTKTIEVNPTIEFGNKHYDRLELQEPTALHMEKALKETSPVRMMIVLVSHVSQWPIGAVEKLPIRVLKEAGTYCLAFFDDGQTDGAN